MAKLNWNKTNSTKKVANYIVENPSYNKIKTNKIGSDVHIANLAKKCYNTMIKDPKNENRNPEDIWVDSLTWAKSKMK